MHAFKNYRIQRQKYVGLMNFPIVQKDYLNLNLSLSQSHFSSVMDTYMCTYPNSYSN